MPEFSLKQLPEGATMLDLLEKSDLVKSRGEGKRLIEQGGVWANQYQISDIRYQN